MECNEMTTFSPTARPAHPPAGRVHAALQRAVGAFFLLTLTMLTAGCELECAVGVDKERTSTSNRTERTTDVGVKLGADF